MEFRTEKDIVIAKTKMVIIKDVESALDFINNIRYETRCNKILLNNDAMSEDIFILNNGIAEKILQTIIKHKIQFIIYGDFSKYNSKFINDFIYKVNKGKDMLFAQNQQEALNKLNCNLKVSECFE